MSVSAVLPNEVLINVINNLDTISIQRSISQIPELKSLITIQLNKALIKTIISHIKTVSITSYFQNYQFVELVIDDMEFLNNDTLYFKVFKILRILINSGGKYNIRIEYLLPEIDINYLKMFRSLFGGLKDKQKYLLNFPNLVKVKVNSNHLLINELCSYDQLSALNLYYCSSNFFFQVFEYLNLNRHKDVFPSLKHLKIQDYMNESEDVYLKTSDNYISYDVDDDDFDHNSDIDENEFYFDGLEILQNFNTFKLESLTIKNCNLSVMQNMKFPCLKNLKIIAVNDKHIDAYDLINSDNFAFTKREKSKAETHFKSGASLSISNNQFNQLRNFILIGNLNLKKFEANSFGNNDFDNVFIRCVDIEVDSNEGFKEVFANKNNIGTP